jgi:hypothetical protein
MLRSLLATALAAAVATGCTSNGSLTTTSVAGHHPAAATHRSAAHHHHTFVESIARTPTTTYQLVARHFGCPGPCNPLLQSAPTGTSNWRTLRRVASYFGAAVRAARQLVVVAVFEHPVGGAPDAHTTYLISSDSGEIWRMRADPCGGDGLREWDTTNVTIAGGGIAGLCRLRHPPAAYAVVLSHDAGQTFSPRQRVSARATHGGRSWLAGQLSAS